MPNNENKPINVQIFPDDQIVCTECENKRFFPIYDYFKIKFPIIGQPPQVVHNLIALQCSNCLTIFEIEAVKSIKDIKGNIQGK